MRFLDWLNENPYILLIAIILTFCLRCSATPEASTVRLQERSVSVMDDLDKASNDCKTDDCKESLKRAKELIKDSLEIAIDKDSQIQSKQKQIDNQSFYTTIGRGVVWCIVSLLIIGLLFMFRNQILTALKLLI
ncbi:MAG: hypothetical protein IPL26_13150 [Leptospiraceae bacterium]|nr:hypothetical protein [Leptospiraceae bacterium]MBK8396170.1 hypothetical protein [Leptospiraceae bacterium]